VTLDIGGVIRAVRTPSLPSISVLQHRSLHHAERFQQGTDRADVKAKLWLIADCLAKGGEDS
jgi:hypothetical protein